jgi:hypothetical protein
MNGLAHFLLRQPAMLALLRALQETSLEHIFTEQTAGKRGNDAWPGPYRDRAITPHSTAMPPQ